MLRGSFDFFFLRESSFFMAFLDCNPKHSCLGVSTIGLSGTSRHIVFLAIILMFWHHDFYLKENLHSLICLRNVQMCSFTYCNRKADFCNACRFKHERATAVSSL